MFFHLENAKGRFRFYKELLSSSMGVEAGCMIPDDTFVKACHIALKGYLHNELEEDADDEAAGNNTGTSLKDPCRRSGRQVFRPYLKQHRSCSAAYADRIPGEQPECRRNRKHSGSSSYVHGRKRKTGSETLIA